MQAQADQHGLPVLPPGYTAQQAWGFRDVTGRFSYEFCRVYRPPSDLVDHRGPISKMDAALSYWVVTWHALGGPTTGTSASRSMNYAEARKVSGAQLTFSKFSSSRQMRDEIPRLLRVNEIAIEPPPGITPG